MVPRSVIVFLVLLVFVGACASEQITQEGTGEPRQASEVEPARRTPTPASSPSADSASRGPKTPPPSTPTKSTQSTDSSGSLIDVYSYRKDMDNDDTLCSHSAAGPETILPPDVPSPTPPATSYQPVPKSPCGDFPKNTGRDFREAPRSFSARKHDTNHFLEWTPDGKQLMLNVPEKREAFGSSIYLVNVDGSDSRFLVDANRWYIMHHGFHADLSPDGTLLVYTSCQFTVQATLPPERLKTYRRDYSTDHREYELAVLEIGTGATTQLTHSVYSGENPAWSPDGSQIAFLAEKHPGEFMDLYTMARDGSDIRVITPIADPSWRKRTPPSSSPDGKHIAFLSWGGPRLVGAGYLYTVEPDGSGLHRIASVTSLPSWSPEGNRLAFGHRIFWDSASHRKETQEVPLPRSTLCMAELDESGRPSISPITPKDAFKGIAEVRHVNWSPDGEEILLIVDEGDLYITYDDDGKVRTMIRGTGISPPLSSVYLIRPDGTNLRKLIEGERPYTVSAWSPDSSQVALRVDPQLNSFDIETRFKYRLSIDEFEVVIVDRDGEVKNVLTREEILGTR